MALTKVRLPVADISAISWGTSEVTILSSGGDIDINIAGTDILNIRSTDVTVGAVPLVAATVTGETVNLTTVAGADATLETGAASATLETTTAHPLILGANSLTSLTIATDAKVALAVEGTGATHLITKNYVDTAVALLPALSDIVGVIATTGSLTIPNSSGNDLIIKWGKTGNIGAVTQAVSFAAAFPTAIFTVYLSLNNTSSSGDNNTAYGAETTAGFNIYKGNSGSHPVSWFAIGY